MRPAELKQKGKHWVIRGHNWPLGILVPGHPQACQLAESLVSDLLGMPVSEQCQKSDPPHGRFVIGC